MGTLWEFGWGSSVFNANLEWGRRVMAAVTAAAVVVVGEGIQLAGCAWLGYRKE